VNKYTAVNAWGMVGAKQKMNKFTEKAKLHAASIQNNRPLIDFLEYVFKEIT